MLMTQDQNKKDFNIYILVLTKFIILCFFIYLKKKISKVFASDCVYEEEIELEYRVYRSFFFLNLELELNYTRDFDFFLFFPLQSKTVNFRCEYM